MGRKESINERDPEVKRYMNSLCNVQKKNQQQKNTKKTNKNNKNKKKNPKLMLLAIKDFIQPGLHSKF